MSLLPAVGNGDGPATHLVAADRAVGAVEPSVPLTDPVGAVGGFVGRQIVEAVADLMTALVNDFLAQPAAPVARYVLSTLTCSRSRRCGRSGGCHWGS